MGIFSIIILVLLGTLFYAPVYAPFVVSFFLRSREVRWCLRASSFSAVLMAVVSPPGLVRSTTGQDIAGSFSAASHNIPIYFAWVWGGSLLLHSLGIWIGRTLHRRREREAV
jgi:hypothetical protein